MQPSVFSTVDLPRDQQLDAWRAWYDPVYDVPETDPAPGFAAETSVWNLGGVLVGRVRAPGLHSVRSAAHIRRSPIDHWVVTIGGRETRITHRHGRFVLPARTPFLCSLGDPLESQRGDDDRLHLYLPRDSCAALAPALDSLSGSALSGTMGRLLADYLLLLDHSLPDIAADDQPRLAAAVIAMVGACVGPTADRLASVAEQAEIAQLARIRTEIRRRLGAATLSPASLCRAVGMSRSALYRLLEGEGGVAHYIRLHRLRATYEALSDPADRRPIAKIAEACGFFDASTFSRAFRQEFGLAPSDVRAAADVGGPRPAASRLSMEAEHRNLQACLRRF